MCVNSNLYIHLYILLYTLNQRSDIKNLKTKLFELVTENKVNNTKDDLVKYIDEHGLELLKN